jgi:hypothetical protein
MGSRTSLVALWLMIVGIASFGQSWDEATQRDRPAGTTRAPGRREGGPVATPSTPIPEVQSGSMYFRIIPPGGR